MRKHEPLPKVYAGVEEEFSDLDRQEVEAGLAEIERGEVITLAELRQELDQNRRNTN
jgi:predicted transcriptional regulator